MAYKHYARGAKGIDLFNTCGMHTTPSKPDFSCLLLAATTTGYDVSSVRNVKIWTPRSKLGRGYVASTAGQAVKNIPLGNQCLARENIVESFHEFKITLRLDSSQR